MQKELIYYKINKKNAQGDHQSELFVHGKKTFFEK